jgi:acyl carrier protein
VVDPESLWRVANGLSVEVIVTYSDDLKDSVDAQYLNAPHVDSIPVARPRPLGSVAAMVPQGATNAPLRARRVRELITELRAHLQERLPDYMIPSGMVALERLPLTPNGKIDRRALPPLDGPRFGTAEYVAPRDSHETRVTEIWQEVLQVHRIGANDNFFDLGGHSLMATQIISRIREAFEVDVPLVSLFENPTIAGLAAMIRDRHAADPTLAAAAAGREVGDL